MKITNDWDDHSPMLYPQMDDVDKIYKIENPDGIGIFKVTISGGNEYSPEWLQFVQLYGPNMYECKDNDNSKEYRWMGRVISWEEIEL